MRSGLPAEPEPDPGGATEPAGRKDVVGRAIASALLIILAICVWFLVDSDEPADPAECATLRATAIELQDITVIYEMDRLGCQDPPYDAVRWP